MTTSDVPLVETERLLLRGHRLDDFEPLAALWTDASITRQIGLPPSTRGDSWGRLLRYVGHWTLLGYGFWAIEEKASGRYAGEIGFADFQRALTPPVSDAPEMGWVLAPWAQGRGYASEAARAAFRWGAAHFGPVTTRCLIDPTNLASIRVAETCGFRDTGRPAWEGAATMLFAASFG
ncbi:MAG: GNAT family N-acetyltransferase [Polyangiaceae bacterium]|jgi:RimJ/RimL family protein N-acetyltransferase|nr:GNAT family N-acetyltransferase [Polyangiaceae bacterium]